MRKYKPVDLPLTDTPANLVGAVARCPNCNDREARVIGLMSRRMVFRCERCSVRFHQQPGIPTPLI